ncbi:MAG: amino acid adenylation domain-containing protein, partial [Marinifilaceae bacterium]|nr:amino acid adenylation domain-containing protein [Marinifilaceae bacterium]
DGISVGILFEEISKLYSGENLPELKIEYKDYVAWQADKYHTERYKKQEKYWLEKCKGDIPVLDMPTDYMRPPNQSFEGERCNFKIPKKIADRLKEVARSNNATLYMGLLAAYNALLYRYTGQEDILVGTPIAGRSHPDLQYVVGMFVNTLIMRNSPKGEQSFIELLSKVKDTALEAYENQDYQFEMLVDKLGIKRDLSRNPLFDTMFAFHNMNKGSIDIAGVKITDYKNENRMAKFDLTLTAIDLDDGIFIELEYRTKLFKRETIERLGQHYLNIIEEVTKNPSIKLREINILSKSEKVKIIDGFNETESEYPMEKTLHELFEEQAEKTPDNIAIVCGNRKLTYRELNKKSNQLARLLRGKGVGPDVIVGIMVERSIEMIIGIYGILKAGGTYLPIDPQHPIERIKYMLQDSKTQVLLTQYSLQNKAEFDGEIINLDDEKTYGQNCMNLGKISKSTDLAYVIYTSGSTGNPKGVMIEHKSIINFIKGMTDEIDFSSNKTILALTTISFDIFLLETLLPLSIGMKVIIANENQQKNPWALNDLIINNQIDIVQVTPSRLQLLIENEKNQSCLKELKHLLVGGEAFPQALFEKVKSRTEAKIYNMYGPTETTIWSTVKDLTTNNNVTIGKPIVNTQAYIVDKNNCIQPIGCKGELCIAGDGLARGYLNRQELTKEKFINNSYVLGERMYRTGDVARWLPDGNIEFLGRIDNQVKIRGYRIELGEIENQLMKYYKVKEAVVLDRKDEGNNKYLCAYIISDEEINLEEIREYLLKYLPEYMIPINFIKIDRIPLNMSGKIDRKTLIELNDNIVTGVDYIPPRNRIEEKLVEIWQDILPIDKKIGIK